MMAAAKMGTFFDDLDALFQKGDQREIENFLTGTLCRLEDEGRGNTAEYASVLNEHACFLRGISRYDESGKAFARSLEILEENGMQHSSRYATIIINYAGLCRLTGRKDELVAAFLAYQSLVFVHDRVSSFFILPAEGSIKPGKDQN